MSEFRVVLHTTHFDESSAFYGVSLGWTYVRGWEDDGLRGCLWAAGDTAVDQRVELLETSGEVEPVSGVFVSVEVADVQAVHDRLVAAGAPITQPLADQPWGHRNVATVDPNGLPIVLFQVL